MRSLKRTLSLLLTAALLLGLVILPASAADEDELPTLTSVSLAETTVTLDGNGASLDLTICSDTGADLYGCLEWSISPDKWGIEVYQLRELLLPYVDSVRIDSFLDAGDYTITATPIEGKCLGEPISVTLTVNHVTPVFSGIYIHGATARGYNRDGEVKTTMHPIYPTDQYGDYIEHYFSNVTIAPYLTDSEVSHPERVYVRKLTEEEKPKDYVEWGIFVSGLAEPSLYKVEADDVWAKFGVYRDDPELYAIELSGPEEIITPPDESPSRTYTYTASFIDQYGDPFTPDDPVTWKIDPYKSEEYYTLDNNGVLTVTDMAHYDYGHRDGDNTFTITATCGEITAKKTITAKHDTSTPIEVGAYTDASGVEQVIDDDWNVLGYNVPRPSGTEPRTVPFVAYVIDQYWENMDVDVTWSCDNTSSAVTFDTTTGVLTVPPETPDGTTLTITATYGDLSHTVTIRIQALNVTWPTLSTTPITYGSPVSSAITLPATGTAMAGTTQLEGKFSLEDPTATPEAGSQNVTVVFTVTSRGSYRGLTTTKEYPISVLSKPVTVTADDKTRPYGEENPTFTFSVPEGALVGNDTVEDLAVTLSCEADKTTLPGTVAITGDYDWCDNYDVTVVPGKLTITKADIPDLTLSDLTVSFGTVPAPSASVGSDSAYGDLTYTYTYVDASGKPVTTPTSVGSYTMTVTAENSCYKATKSATLTITAADLSAATLTLPENFSATYNKTAYTPRVTVTVGDTTLTETRDYTVTYSDNTNAGQATVTVTGAGNYTGTATTNFTIEKASLADLKPLISGKAEAGSVLSATLPDVDPGEVNFFWVVGDTAATAPALSYTVTKNDSNKAISVKAAAVVNGNYDGPAAPSDVLTVSKVTLSGIAMLREDNVEGGTEDLYEVGDTIQVDGYLEPSAARIGSTWQWYRNGVAIDGACGTLSSQNTSPMAYTITSDDAGATLKLVWTGNENFLGTVEESVTVGKTVLTGQAKLLVNGQELITNNKAVVGDVLTLSITAPEGSYDILWCYDDTPFSHTGDSYTITAADLGRSIHVQLVAKDPYTGSIRGDYIDVDPLAPAAPNLHATAGNGKVTLSWSAPASNGSPITGYTLTMDGNTAVDLAPGVTSYTFENLENGTEYSFVLTAINAAGSTPSAAVTATPKAGTSSGGNTSGGGASSDKTENAPTQTENPDGSVTTTVTSPDGTVTSTTTTPDGSETVTALAPDGSSTTTLTRADGVKATLTTTASGAATAQIALTEEGKTTRLTLPASSLTPTTVAVWVKPDGTEEILKTSTVTESGLSLALKESGQFKLVDNAKSFSDTADHWASSSVDFVSSHELFQGVGESAFAPDLSMTRGMLVTVLYRLEGDLKPSDGVLFTDVTSDTWYTDAVVWAAKNGVSTGVSQTSFAPEADITREQLAAMLFRYAQTLGYEAPTEDTALPYADAASVSPWAQTAVRWMTQSGLLTGRADGRMDPQGAATRAEVATVLTRFVTLLTQ